MPGPPPPPPPGMMPPPPPMSLPKAAKPDDRAALLKSIQKGTKLKKTVTNDRSAPLIAGKSSNNNSNNSSPSSLSGTPTSAPNGLNLGGLFAGGMPKLKPTGKIDSYNQNSANNYNNNEQVKRPAPMKNSNSLQNELKKQLANDSRNRGPPPPAPVRNTSEENGSRQFTQSRIGSTNGLHSNQIFHHNIQPQHSTLHRKVKSNVSLNSFDNSEPINGFNQTTKPVISHGKPNVAPKPPILNATKPVAPPKKLITNGKPVGRAHSMKSPRTPSPQSPETNTPIKFGTVRNLSSVIGQSLANSTGNLSSPRPRPSINGRPNAPPPSVPTQQAPPPPYGNPAPLPPSKTGSIKPPNQAPPPPPSGPLPQAPNQTPPLPPHRTMPMRPPPAVPSNNNAAPPPPPRGTSLTSTRKVSVDLEEKYRAMFHDPSTFPKPPPYRNVFKSYGGRQAGKQQAPQPPILHSSNRSWDASSTC